MTHRLDTLAHPSELAELTEGDLEALAAEIRHAIIAQVSKTGGHLAPNLGVVELTIALHRAFAFEHDRLLFDVGHQCYPHKLLTGRLGLLAGLRSSRGMAGFPEPDESSFDLFRVGHAGTGVSTAVGMALGDAAQGQGFDSQARPTGRRAVTLVGDASFVNGLSLEGLNAAGTLNRQLLIVLNDNGMSIGPPQGAVAQRLAGDVPAAHAWLNGFGLDVVGPVDGHDLLALGAALEDVGRRDRPVVLHVKTVKGKGLEFAEEQATRFHSPRPFTYEQAASGCRVEVSSGGRSFSAAVGDALVDLMQVDEAVVACTAAMASGTGIDTVQGRFPDRVVDTGICESHALTLLAGMAKTGLKPFFAVYCTFLQRAFDQAFQEVTLQGLPVRLCLDRAGLVGGDGAVHHGFCDVALLRALPDAVLLAAIDEPSLREALRFMHGWDRSLSAVRYPRESVSPRLADGPTPPFKLGCARRLSEPLDRPDVAILAYGTLALTALDAAAELAPELGVAVYDARFAKPVDTALIGELVLTHVPIVTLEDHSLMGGFGTAVLEAANAMGLDTRGIERLGLPDRWIGPDSRPEQLASVGLDVAGVAAAVRRAAERQATSSIA